MKKIAGPLIPGKILTYMWGLRLVKKNSQSNDFCGNCGTFFYEKLPFLDIEF
jgi:hypothetical protein